MKFHCVFSNKEDMITFTLQPITLLQPVMNVASPMAPTSLGAVSSSAAFISLLKVIYTLIGKVRKEVCGGIKDDLLREKEHLRQQNVLTVTALN